MKRRKKGKDRQEAALESFLFGAEDSTTTDAVEDVTLNWAELEGGAGDSEEDVRPAWQDEDDEEVQVNIAEDTVTRKLRKTAAETVLDGEKYIARLREKHKGLHQDTEWAKLPHEKKRISERGEDSSEDEENDEETAYMRSTDAAADGRSPLLPEGILNVARMQDANHPEPSQAVVQAVRFHPHGQLLMTAGLDKTLRFFQVDGIKNSKVQGVHLAGLPIHCADFTRDGTTVIASGRRKHFFVYDVTKGALTKVPGIVGREEKSFEKFTMSPDDSCVSFFGNNGYIIQVDLRTRRWIANMKMNGTLRGLAYNSDGTCLYSHGGDGEVYVWDVRTRKCINKFMDDGCIHGTAITTSANDRYLATGSDSGVVNIYDSNKLSEEGEKPTPVKAIMNLTTSIDHVKFNHDSQLLVIASQKKKDALRMVHLPSMTVFSNWPTAKTPLHYITALDFSRSSGFLAIGNDRGKVLLYRLNHFRSA